MSGSKKRKANTEQNQENEHEKERKKNESNGLKLFEQQVTTPTMKTANKMSVDSKENHAFVDNQCEKNDIQTPLAKLFLKRSSQFGEKTVLEWIADWKKKEQWFREEEMKTLEQEVKTNAVPLSSYLKKMEKRGLPNCYDFLKDLVDEEDSEDESLSESEEEEDSESGDEESSRARNVLKEKRREERKIRQQAKIEKSNKKSLFLSFLEKAFELEGLICGGPDCLLKIARGILIFGSLEKLGTCTEASDVIRAEICQWM